MGGDHIRVIDLLPQGMDPHDFQPTPADLRKLRGADLLLASGLGLEAYFGSLKSSLDASTATFIAGDAIRPLMLEEGTHAHGKDDDTIIDPHWWHSVKNTARVVEKLGEALAKRDPGNRNAYTDNARAYQEQLEELDRWIRVELAKVPRSQRVLVTSHHALEYFAREHGFRILAIEGISPKDQPSSKKVRELIAEIRDGGARAMFAENIENPKVLVEITRETGIKPGGVLYADGLGGNGASDYLGMMHHNVSTIVNALQ